MTDTNISAEMRGAIGSELGRRVSFPVAESDIRRWAIAVYYPAEPPRLFWDAAHGGIVAPEEFNPFAWMTAAPRQSGSAAGSGPRADVDPNDPDRTERLIGIPGPGLKFQLNGGMEAEYGVRMRPGDVITAVNRLVEYRERPGRLGLMLFTITEDTWTNQDGEPVKRARQTLIRY